MRSITKKYTRDDVTVVWKPDVCIHSGICAKGLSAVFNPRIRPWINMEGAELDAIKKQVALCPSGALSIQSQTQDMESKDDAIKIQASKDGPLLIQGPVHVQLSNGEVVIKEKSAALCRCGQSANKPFCDGTHKRNGWTEAS